jgi:hypothetical protein
LREHAVFTNQILAVVLVGEIIDIDVDHVVVLKNKMIEVVSLVRNKMIVLVVMALLIVMTVKTVMAVEMFADNSSVICNL